MLIILPLHVYLNQVSGHEPRRGIDSKCENNIIILCLFERCCMWWTHFELNSKIRTSPDVHISTFDKFFLCFP